MSIGIDLSPYSLQSVETNDNFFTHYAAVGAEGNTFVVTEFSPAYMIQRSDAGIIDITPRFVDEYEAALEKFVNMAESMQRMNEVSIMRIDDIIRKNNTAYVARPTLKQPGLVAFMGDKKMPFNEAYAFIRPLLMSLVEAEKKGLFFSFTDENLRVNRYGQVIMDCVYTWDASFQTTIKDVILLFYRLLTGKKFNASRNALQEEGVELPPRLNAMISEVLKGDVLYGSVDDFNKKFKFIMDIEGEKDEPEEPEERDDKASLKTMKIAAIALSSAVVFAIGFLLVYNVLIPAYYFARPNLANPELIEAPPEPNFIASDAIDYSFITLANPADPNDILNGAFCDYNGTLFSRVWYEEGYHLAKKDAGRTVNTLIFEARPAFITARDGFVYFSDGMDAYKLYRIPAEGGTLELLSNNSALFIRIDGQRLYYTNHDDKDFLYVYDLSAMTDTPYIKAAVYDTLIYGGRLYFINGSRGFNLFSATPVEEGEPVLTRLNSDKCDNLRIYRSMLFYIDTDGNDIRCITLDGRPVSFECPVKARSFDINGSVMTVIETGTNRLFNYDMDSKTLERPTYEPAAYAQVEDDAVYMINFDDVRVTQRMVRE